MFRVHATHVATFTGHMSKLTEAQVPSMAVEETIGATT
jgi:hypothetical protein